MDYDKKPLIQRLVQELKIKNFSKKRIRSYVLMLNRSLNKNPELTEQEVNFIQTEINKKDPSTVLIEISSLINSTNYKKH